MVDSNKMREVCKQIVSFYECDEVRPLFGHMCKELNPDFIYLLMKEYLKETNPSKQE